MVFIYNSHTMKVVQKLKHKKTRSKTNQIMSSEIEQVSMQYTIIHPQTQYHFLPLKQNSWKCKSSRENRISLTPLALEDDQFDQNEKMEWYWYSWGKTCECNTDLSLEHLMICQSLKQMRELATRKVYQFLHQEDIYHRFLYNIETIHNLIKS